MTVSLLEILAAARAHVAPLAAESAGYLLLAVTDHVAAAPRAVTADEVELMPDGSVRLRARRGIVADVGAEQMLRQLLARTLAVASSVGPALRRAAQRPEDTGLPALVRELETALIPVNRAAAKRALSRLHRETERAKSAGKLAALLDAEATPVVAAPVVAAPVVAAPVVAAPVVAPVVTAPVVQPMAEPVAWLAEFPELSPPVVPVVKAASLPLVAATTPRAPQRLASPAPELTPEPQLAVGEPAFTRPEPVVQRAKERGNSTPRLGTLVTLQTLPGEESERTERAPAVATDEELLDLPNDFDVDIDVDIELEELAPELGDSAAAPQPLIDPEPSRMPDVLTAMLELHTGVAADEAPTRIRDVITELRVSPVVIAAAPVLVTPTPAPVVLTPTPSLAESVASAPVVVAVATPAPVVVALATPVPLAVVTPMPLAVATPVPLAVATPVPVAVATPVPVAVATPVPVAAAMAVAASAPVLTPAPELVEDGWLTHSSLSGIESGPRIFVSERVDPALHDALTWDPGPVVPLPKPAPPPPALTIAEPLPEPSPYAPAVLPSRTSDVSELLDSFYVSDAAEERDLRSALKGMAGLELTPMPHPYVKEG